MLDGLTGPPFEPLDQADVVMLSIKTAFLLAMASAERAGDLCALSVHPSCMSISIERGALQLRPNPSFQPKVITSTFRSRVIRLRALCPPPHEDREGERLHTLCPV